MKICLINNLFGTYSRGGAERIVEKIENGLKEKGHSVFVISTSPKKDEIQGNIYFLKSCFNNLDKIPFVFRFFYHIWDGFNFINYFKIKTILKKENPDIVMTHNLKGIGFLIPSLINKLGTKHIHTIHDITLLHPSGLMFYKKEGIINTLHAKIYQFLNKALFKSPEVVVSPSKWLIDLHLKKGFFPKSNKKIIPNFFIENKFKKENSKFQIPNSKYKFLYVGQIEGHKGVDVLVKAFGVALEHALEHALELTIIGSGSRINKIKELAQGKEEIKILGRVENKEILQFIKDFDYLVVPSICYENSPTVIYEAIKADLLVIASKIGGIPELIEKYGGLMFEPGNSDDLAQKIINATQNYKNLKKESKNINLIKTDYIEKLLA